MVFIMYMVSKLILVDHDHLNFLFYIIDEVVNITRLMFEGSLEGVTLLRLASLSLSKAKFKSPYNFEKSPTYFCHVSVIKLQSNAC